MPGSAAGPRAMDSCSASAGASAPAASGWAPAGRGRRRVRPAGRCPALGRGLGPSPVEAAVRPPRLCRAPTRLVGLAVVRYPGPVRPRPGADGWRAEAAWRSARSKAAAARRPAAADGPSRGRRRPTLRPWATSPRRRGGEDQQRQASTGEQDHPGAPRPEPARSGRPTPAPTSPPAGRSWATTPCQWRGPSSSSDQAGGGDQQQHGATERPPAPEPGRQLVGRHLPASGSRAGPAAGVGTPADRRIGPGRDQHPAQIGQERRAPAPGPSRGRRPRRGRAPGRPGRPGRCRYRERTGRPATRKATPQTSSDWRPRRRRSTPAPGPAPSRGRPAGRGRPVRRCAGPGRPTARPGRSSAAPAAWFDGRRVTVATAATRVTAATGHKERSGTGAFVTRSGAREPADWAVMVDGRMSASASD